MTIADSKAFVLYVWDNDKRDIVGLFRAVGPGIGARGGVLSGRKLQRLYDFHGVGPLLEKRGFRWPRRPLPLVFDIAHIREFVSSLRVLYPESRYAIRDWLAESLEDFLSSRYQCGDAEFAAYRRRIADPFSSDEPSAVPIPLGDYQRWHPSGIELGRRFPGLRVFAGDLVLFSEKSGYAVLRKDAVERDMRRQGLDPVKDGAAYTATLRAQGFKVSISDPEMPRDLVCVTAFSFEAQEWILQLARDTIEVRRASVPAHEKEFHLLLMHRCPKAEIRAVHGAGQRYHLEGLLKATKERAQMWIGTHRLECLRAFGTERLCTDGEEAP